MESRSPDDRPARSLVTLERVHLAYGSTKVLKDINLSIHESETHALVGEHAAGKTSLCSVISGGVRPTSGRLWIDGTPYPSLTVGKAREIGIEMVHQNNPLFDNLSIADNLFVTINAFFPSTLFSHRRNVERSRRFLEENDFQLDPEKPLRDLAPADRTLIDILKHLSMKPRLVILDESLDKLKVENLYRVLEVLNRLKAEGSAILFVTHRIDDIYQIADRVTILREGEIYDTDSVKNIGKINLIKMAYTQITEPKRFGVTKKEFYQLLKYNEAILQNLPVNLIVVDNDHKIKLFNTWTRRFFRLDSAAVYNLPLSKLFHTANKQIYSLVERALSAGETETFYGVSLQIGEAHCRTTITVQPILDGTFRIGSMIIIEDITEQEQMREHMVLSEKLASVGLLSAGVAHEINSPLETIHNFTEYLKYKFQDSETAEILAHIDEEVDSISRIVGNLISFSERAPVDEEVFEMNGLIEHIIELIRFDARSKRITITFDRCKGPLLLQAGQNEMKQVILNLLKNSYDAMTGGGDIRISTSVQTNGKGNRGPVAEIVFQDTGPGIDEENIHNVFQPFYSTKTSGQHIGLGLSVSYGIVRKYKGEISAANLPGGGCEFRIVIPQQNAAESSLSTREIIP